MGQTCHGKTDEDLERFCDFIKENLGEIRNEVGEYSDKPQSLKLIPAKKTKRVSGVDES